MANGQRERGGSGDGCGRSGEARTGSSGGGGNAAAKTRQLGRHDQETEKEFAPKAWEVESRLGPRETLRLLLWFYL